MLRAVIRTAFTRSSVVGAVVVSALVTLTSAQADGAGPSARRLAAHPSARAAAHTCRFVRKRIHGRLRRVRVCTKPPAKPALPSAGTVVATIPVGAAAGPAASGDGGLWVTLNGAAIGDPTAIRIDPASNSITARVTAPQSAFYDVGVSGGSLWIANFDQDSVSRFDDVTGGPLGLVPLPAGTAPEGIAFTGGGVWVAGHHGNPTGSVLEIDPTTNTVTTRIAAGAAQDCCGPQEMAVGAGALWVDIPNQSAVDRIDPVSKKVVATIPAPPACGYVAADETAVWIAAGCNSLAVTRIDPATNAVVAKVTLPAVSAVNGPPAATGVAIAYGSVWAVTDGGAHGELVRIDPQTNRVVASTNLPAGGASIVAAAGDLWVGSGRNVLRIHPRM
jgi:hypothetical protein